jgi:hypothetical protein
MWRNINATLAFVKMLMNWRLRRASVVALASLAFGQQGQYSYVPKAGFVPDSATAVSVAEAVLTPVYGRDTVVSERPYKAVLKGMTWVVTGTLHCQGPSGASCFGGTAEVRILKRSGAIILMTHTQ